MGTHISLFKETEEQSKSKLDTSQSDWITSHADLSGCRFFLNIDVHYWRFEFSFVFHYKVAVVEVQRCWNRFFQLGGNKNGLIEKSVLEKSDLFNSEDIIIKNVIYCN